MAKSAKAPSLDLGAVQNEVELSTITFKKALSELQKANRIATEAEERYIEAQRALASAFNMLRAQTKLAI